MFSPDKNITNADWTKKTWDLPANLKTEQDMAIYARGKGLSLEQFKQLPVYQFNRNKIADPTVKLLKTLNRFMKRYFP